MCVFVCVREKREGGIEREREGVNRERERSDSERSCHLGAREREREKERLDFNVLSNLLGNLRPRETRDSE